MNNFKITVMSYGFLPCDKGRLTPGYDAGLMIKIPFVGYLLENGTQTILVDCGVNDQFFANGGGWGGNTPNAGASWVLSSLEKAGKTPEDVDMVIYTHLHNDHAGNCDLFPRAVHIYQKDEYENLLCPLPNQIAGREYDFDVIDRLKALPNKLVVDGDINMCNGLQLIKTPGHTRGSQTIVVPTDNGPRFIIGDLIARYFALFPEMDEQIQPDGEVVKITPMDFGPCPIFVSPLIYDHEDFFNSYYKLRAMAPAWEPKYFLPGHEPSLIYTGVL